MFKYIILAAVLACAFAEEVKEDERVKKDVLLGTLPYAYASYPQVYTKYVAPVAPVAPIAPVAHVPAISYPAVSTYSAVAHGVPAYVHSPYAYGAYVKPALVY